MSTTFAELAAALSGLLSLSSASVECGLWPYDAAWHFCNTSNLFLIYFVGAAQMARLNVRY
jgi:hypothetical protein